MDLATGHQLFGLAIVYDWCYRDLDEAARQQIRETLVKRTSAMFEAAATGKAWWQRSYLQNHLWVNITGMAASGIALFDEVDDAAGWIGLPLDKYPADHGRAGPDGASPRASATGSTASSTCSSSWIYPAAARRGSV